MTAWSRPTNCSSPTGCWGSSNTAPRRMPRPAIPTAAPAYQREADVIALVADAAVGRQRRGVPSPSVAQQTKAMLAEYLQAYRRRRRLCQYRHSARLMPVPGSGQGFLPKPPAMKSMRRQRHHARRALPPLLLPLCLFSCSVTSTTAVADEEAIGDNNFCRAAPKRCSCPNEVGRIGGAVPTWRSMRRRSGAGSCSCCCPQPAGYCRLYTVVCANAAGRCCPSARPGPGRQQAPRAQAPAPVGSASKPARVPNRAVEPRPNWPTASSVRRVIEETEAYQRPHDASPSRSRRAPHRPAPCSRGRQPAAPLRSIAVASRWRRGASMGQSSSRLQQRIGQFGQPVDPPLADPGADLRGTTTRGGGELLNAARARSARRAAPEREICTRADPRRVRPPVPMAGHQRHDTSSRLARDRRDRRAGQALARQRSTTVRGQCPRLEPERAGRQRKAPASRTASPASIDLGTARARICSRCRPASPLGLGASARRAHQRRIRLSAFLLSHQPVQRRAASASRCRP